MANQVLGLFTDEPRLQNPGSRPADVDQLLAGNTRQPMAQQPAGAPAARAPQVNGLFNNLARGGAAGVAAGDQGGPVYDETSAAVNIGTGTVAGAVAGAEVGGPWGAVAGGVLGLATSSVQAWQQLGAENKRKRDMEALTREIEDKNNARDKRDRQDALSQLRYDRKQAAFQKAWGVNAAQRDSITSLINQNTTLRARYLKTGIRRAYA